MTANYVLPTDEKDVHRYFLDIELPAVIKGKLTAAELNTVARVTMIIVKAAESNVPTAIDVSVRNKFVALISDSDNVSDEVEESFHNANRYMNGCNYHRLVRTSARYKRLLQDVGVVESYDSTTRQFVIECRKVDNL